MKAKLVLVLILVALLCASVASAGFFDWVTGKAITLKSLFKKSPATNTAVPPADKAVAANNAAPAADKKVQNAPAEFDSSPVKFSGDVLLTHIDNRLRQMENSLKLVEKKWDTSIKSSTAVKA